MSARGEDVAEQRDVIAFLSDPATHGGAPVERVDTHISHIFIAAGRAYKLKRAVRFTYLDFSTLALRRAACMREIEVNQPNAPTIYRRAAPIVREGGRLRFGDQGAAEDGVVDWVVEMAAFDRTLEFDALLDAGRLTPARIEALADAVSDAHKRAVRRPEAGGGADMRAVAKRIAEAISAAPGGALAGRAERWAADADVALARVSGQLDRRRAHGYVRRCHGDLHLGNICLFEGRPTPFDAIEFSETIASIDVLYDLAFPAMDFIARGAPEHATLLISRYLSATRDYSGLALMSAFIALRAAVRAMVAASGPAPQAAAALMDLAERALAPAGAPRLIAVGGLSGSGKSTLARLLAPSLAPLYGAATIRSDLARKRLFGVAPGAPLPREGYEAAAGRAVYAAMRKDAGRALRAGAAVVLDATFLDPHERDALEPLARRCGARFDGLWLDLGLEALQARVARRAAEAPDDPSDATPAVVARQWTRRGAPARWTALDAHRSQTEILTAARAALGL